MENDNPNIALLTTILLVTVIGVGVGLFRLASWAEDHPDCRKNQIKRIEQRLDTLDRIETKLDLLLEKQ